MAYCTIGVSKQKGGSVGSSGGHNDRERETPNADPERTHLNRVLIGDDRPVRERVNEIISEHGGKPRRDSVEAVELLLSASHEYFVNADGEIDQERLGRWVGQAVKFLSDRRNCGVCAKAVLHLDERTPHIHAHMVPITDDGRLSATHFLDGRKKMKALHTRHASYMRELGLERGREGSRATHQRVKQFYASVTKEPELEVEPDRIPDPGRLKLLTAEAARAYKLEVLAHVLDELRVERNELHEKFLAERHEKGEALRLARERGDRLRDVPLTEVMTALDYHGERRGESVLYRAGDGRVLMTVTDSEARNFEGRVICRNSVDLVLFMENVNKGRNVSLDEAISWLAEKFGEGRAAAAYVARSEQSVAGFLEERRLERERQTQGREPELGRQEPDHEPPGYSPGR